MDESEDPTEVAFKSYGDLVVQMERDAKILQDQAQWAATRAAAAVERASKLRVAYDAWGLSLDKTKGDDR